MPNPVNKVRLPLDGDVGAVQRRRLQQSRAVAPRLRGAHSSRRAMRTSVNCPSRIDMIALESARFSFPVVVRVRTQGKLACDHQFVQGSDCSDSIIVPSWGAISGCSAQETRLEITATMSPTAPRLTHIALQGPAVQGCFTSITTSRQRGGDGSSLQRVWVFHWRRPLRDPCGMGAPHSPRLPRSEELHKVPEDQQSISQEG